MQNSNDKTQPNTEDKRIARDMQIGNPPHVATEKCQRCKSCKYMRMPHRSNAHYTCEVRHTTIEPTWTCDLFYDKKSKDITI
jgi:hypothetical protein